MAAGRKVLGLVLVVSLATLFAGCGSGNVDLSSAHWRGGNDPSAQDTKGWPRWDSAPRKGVKFGERSIPEMDRLEYATFLWDERGLYGMVFAFSFPTIEVACEGEAVKAVEIVAAPGTKARETLGSLHAYQVHAGQRQELAPSQFRFIDRGWVMKPGQCQSEFFLSWEALGRKGVPRDTVTIRLKGRVLTLPAPGGRQG